MPVFWGRRDGINRVAPMSLAHTRAWPPISGDMIYGRRSRNNAGMGQGFVSRLFFVAISAAQGIK